MKGKRIRESAILLAQVMNPQDANPAGNVHGGVIMKLIDTAAGAAAIKHSQSNCVTASIDRLDFHNPVFVGDLVTLRASINYTGKSSMEAGVRVESQNLLTGQTRHTVSAYMTLVALDRRGKPTSIPPIIPETADEHRRNREAQSRRETRLREKTKEKACQLNSESCE
ncbi:MAG TPA: acyl-CoA thioesterase [Syntrophales bacterium]|nr:acyl-CoA thioesterase [Syntrophales bacterium]